MYKFVIDLLSSKPENRHVLKNMRSEFRNRFKVSSDICIDAIASKTIFETLAKKITGNIKINGFIQNIGLDPFGFLLMSAIQVMILFKGYDFIVPQIN